MTFSFTNTQAASCPQLTINLIIIWLQGNLMRERQVQWRTVWRPTKDILLWENEVDVKWSIRSNRNEKLTGKCNHWVSNTTMKPLPLNSHIQVQLANNKKSSFYPVSELRDHDLLHSSQSTSTVHRCHPTKIQQVRPKPLVVSVSKSVTHSLGQERESLCWLLSSAHFLNKYIRFWDLWKHPPSTYSQKLWQQLWVFSHSYSLFLILYGCCQATEFRGGPVGGAERAAHWLLSKIFAYAGTPNHCGNRSALV